ncbi:nucleotidyltransferase domain-containing protein [Polaribacter gochangensis]|uniref:nucleotidyltransferase domain-containing protein n=1 Tax=Polaribacter gochangensis TaxID=3252903 RepID=UPI0039047648
MMTYKETLFFVGKCLTITHEEHNRKIVEQEIKSGNVDWDTIVKVSTAHYVFPALYCNLKRANLLSYLPEELVNYMKRITDLNRKRNLQIIEQAKEVNELLLANNITPIFLKGTAFLIESLFEDIAERMVGDIDFLVTKESYKTTINILKKEGYNTKEKEEHIIFPSIHYPKMTKKNSFTAIEIHSKVILSRYYNSYNYSFFIKKNRLFGNFTIPSVKTQILHNCINKQFGDNGRYYNLISLRNSYDLHLLSIKENTLEIIQPHKLFFKSFNKYIAISKFILNSNLLSFEKNKAVSIHQKAIIFFLNHPSLQKTKILFINFLMKNKNRAITIFKSIYKKSYRDYLIYKFSILYLTSSKSNPP